MNSSFRIALGCLAVVACSTPPAAPEESAAGTPDAATDLTFSAKTDGWLADAEVAGPGDVGDAGADLDAAAADGIAADAGGVDTSDDGDGKKTGFDYACKPLSTEACTTDCGSIGTRKCLKEWGPCIPPPEACDNCADDDCDGAIDEGCTPNPTCAPPVVKCPTALITVTEGAKAGTGAMLHLSAAGSLAQGTAKVSKWLWSVQAPLGAAAQFLPGANVEKPTFVVDVAGQYLFHLAVWDDVGVPGCAEALSTIEVVPDPPLPSAVGCADKTREGFLDEAAYPQIAGCAGAWEKPGVTPDTVVPTCGNQGGNSGAKADGMGCSSADLCSVGWHVCKGWQEVAQKSPTGCVDATPANAPSKSLFFAIRQPSASGSVCGQWGDGFNDVFGCGNLGNTVGADKNCGPLDRILASTVANKCGFNEAEPNLGPWECIGPGKSDLAEGANVTKKACQGGSCQTDGQSVSPWQKGGVLCCAGK